jgi:hypothetical protein
MRKAGFSYAQLSNETSDSQRGELLVHNNHYDSRVTINSVPHTTVTNAVPSNTFTPKLIQAYLKSETGTEHNISDFHDGEIFC